MASPVDANRLATSIATAVDPWTVNLPTGITAGQLLIMLVRSAGAQTVASAPTGWTALITNNVADATDDVTGIYYRWADGSEGSTVSVDWSAAAKGFAIVWRVTGAINPATQVPQVTAGATHTTTANTANPGSISPTGGSKDYLFIAVMGQGGELNSPTVAPTNYGNLVPGNSGTAGAVGTNCTGGGGSRQVTTATEDPAVFTHPAADLGGIAFTIAIHPAPPHVRKSLKSIRSAAVQKASRW